MVCILIAQCTASVDPLQASTAQLHTRIRLIHLHTGISGSICHIDAAIRVGASVLGGCRHTGCRTVQYAQLDRLRAYIATAAQPSTKYLTTVSASVRL